MKHTHKIFIALLFSVFLIACGNEKKEKSVRSTTAEAKVETFALQRQSITSEVSLPAELSGFRQVDLFAKVASFVKTLKVDIGSEVKSGQLLIELEAPEISSQLAAAQSRLHSQEAIYTASSSTYQRLLETSKVEGTISKNDLELALARKNSDQAQLQVARASMREIQVMQGYLQIRAPFNGKVTARNINTGAFVGQGATVPLLTVQDNQKLRLAVSVPEAYYGYLKVGDELGFKVTSPQGETFRAQISRMSGALDTRLRSERVELDVINTGGTLIPGMVAEVLLPLKSRKKPFAVARTAVMTTSEGVFVIKVVNNKALRVKVELGLESGDTVEIFSDILKENDTLINKPNEEIRDGSEIK